MRYILIKVHLGTNTFLSLNPRGYVQGQVDFGLDSKISTPCIILSHACMTLMTLRMHHSTVLGSSMVYIFCTCKLFILEMYGRRPSFSLSWHDSTIGDGHPLSIFQRWTICHLYIRTCPAVKGQNMYRSGSGLGPTNGQIEFKGLWCG